MKLQIIISFFCLFSNYCFCQVPADSLPGTYVGQFWLANPSTSPWVITPDTLYVLSDIDTVNCELQFISNYISSQGGPYYTDYFSCNTPNPANAYMKFYSGDSVRVIVDNYPQPYPDPAKSIRFYGKRISKNTSSSVNKTEKTIPVIVYPNPATEFLFIDSKALHENVQLEFSDLLGRTIKTEKLELNGRIRVDVSDLPKGVFFIIIKTSQGIFNKKVIINK